MVRSILVSPPQGITTDRLVVVKRVPAGTRLADPFFSYPDYRDYARSARTVQNLTAWANERLTISTDAGVHAVFGAVVPANYHETFGVALTSGRRFTADDDRPGAPLVAIISERLWRERFGSEPGILGRAISVSGKQATIVGVAGGGFGGALMNMLEDIWLPIAAYHQAGPHNPIDNRDAAIVAIAGQLAPDASLAEARAEFATLTAQLQAAISRERTNGIRAYVGDYSGTALLPIAEMAPYFLAAFSVITLLTLLIVSANVANLMLGTIRRAPARNRRAAVARRLEAAHPPAARRGGRRDRRGRVGGRLHRRLVDHEDHAEHPRAPAGPLRRDPAGLDAGGDGDAARPVRDDCLYGGAGDSNVAPAAAAVAQERRAERRRVAGRGCRTRSSCCSSRSRSSC